MCSVTIKFENTWKFCIMISDSPSSNCLTCLDNTKIINDGKNLAATGRTALVLHSLPWGKRNMRAWKRYRKIDVGKRKVFNWPRSEGPWKYTLKKKSCPPFCSRLLFMANLQLYHMLLYWRGWHTNGLSKHFQVNVWCNIFWKALATWEQNISLCVWSLISVVLNDLILSDWHYDV